MTVARRRSKLFGCECERFAAVLDHLTHLADAFGALGRALVRGENLFGTGRAGLDGLGDITLAKTITVADVQEALHVSLTENGSL